MTSLHVSDFKLGLDTRKGILTAEPGSLRTLDNAVITDGGEVQKRMAFTLVATLPAGATHGLHGTNTGGAGTEQLWVFADGEAGARIQLTTVTLPDGVNAPLFYYGLAPGGIGETLVRVRDVAEYGPQQFFVAGDTTFGLRNWWNGLSVPSYIGYAPMVTGQKMYRVQSSYIYFAGVGDPSVTNPLNPAGTGPNTVNPGAGFIDTSRLDDSSMWLIGMEAYYKQVAVFSRRTCILFTLDPDPANNVDQQTLKIGAVSNGAIKQFGTGDVLFLADNGIRSLRVLNASLAAGVTDVGSPIDNIMRAALAANRAVAPLCEAVTDPLTGRYWLALGNTIYVLSYWPSAKISAWSTFTLPFQIDHIAVAGTSIFLRSGDNIYLYGGSGGAEYDNSVATVRTPHMDAQSPTTEKKTVSVAVMASGTWSVNIGMAPDNPSFYEHAATLTGGTYGLQRVPFVGKGTHIGFTLTCADAGPSVLGGLSVRFAQGREV